MTSLRVSMSRFSKFLPSLLLLISLSEIVGAANLASLSPSLLLAVENEISGNEAARQVQDKTGGKVLRVKDAGNVFKVKVLLPNGIVEIYSVDKRQQPRG